ncbi:hypothetical protein JN00_0019 [Metamycoplasma subdolum]|uniref:Lipoprotein n=1 Tax=Metamycoplasma subdolum TaxID=92407 RepID=A0A3M0A985_9BACT|nr:hypothetical protein [Metamycoplasma subdolum]RMA78975.1 hypothetical protein JN00_0019 [Metamycoplasma subdolum]WPB50498.1 hypothetical protein R9C05_02725 [Metamycoplasma subdolum]
MKKIKTLSYILIAGLPTFSLTAISCAKDRPYLNLAKISRVYLNKLNLNQISNLENGAKIFYYYKGKNQKTYKTSFVENNKLILVRENGERDVYTPDFSHEIYWKETSSSFNTTSVIDTLDKTDLNKFMTTYDFDSIDSANGYGDQWYEVLTEKTGQDFIRTGDPYFADLQSIIFRIIYDYDIDYNYMNSKLFINKNKETKLLDGFFHTKYIQAETWLSKEYENQRKKFETFMLLYLNKFNVNAHKIDIDWSKATVKHSLAESTSYVQFQVKDILDKDNKSLLNDSNKNKTFYINGFRNYATSQKFGVGFSGLKESLPLFNEYVENPLLLINSKYISVIDNINEFAKGGVTFDFWNIKGLMYYFNYFKDEILFLEVPSYRAHEDLFYKIIDVKFVDYLDTNQLFKVTVRVYKKDKTFKDYVWISSNFDDHGHRLKGMILENKMDKLTSDDIYSYDVGMKPLPDGIKLSDFLKTDIANPTVFQKLLKMAGEQLENIFRFWNNDSRSEFETDFLKSDSKQIYILGSYINNYLLSYSLATQAGKIRSGVKRIDLEVLEAAQEIGRVKLKLLFKGWASENDFDFISKGEKELASVTLYWNGFKGFNKNKYGDELFTIEKIEIGGI